MKCELCHQAEAVTVIWKEEAGVKREFYVCAACAARFAPKNKKKKAEADHANPQDFFPKKLILRSLQSFGHPGQEEPAVPPCPNCGTTLDSVLSTNIVGCPKCFEYFLKSKRFASYLERVFYRTSLSPKVFWAESKKEDVPTGLFKGTKSLHDVVLQTRFFLFRNLARRLFPSSCTPKQNQTISHLITDILLRAHKGLVSYDSTKIPYSEALKYRERLVVGDSFLEPMFSSVLLEDTSKMVDGSPWGRIIVNGECHLRFQATSTQFNLSQLYKRVQGWSEKCKQLFHYATAPKLGYLTSDLYWIGVAFRIESMVHLPALTLQNEIKPVLRGLQQLHYVVAPIDPFSTEFVGAYYRIRNAQTLWTTDQEIIERHERMVKELVRQERQARERLNRDKRLIVEDLIARSLAIMSVAKLVSPREMIALLSDVRFGVEMGLLHVSSSLDSLLFDLLPGSLSCQYGENKSEMDLNQIRAQSLREFSRNFINEA